MVFNLPSFAQYFSGFAQQAVCTMGKCFSVTNSRSACKRIAERSPAELVSDRNRKANGFNNLDPSGCFCYFKKYVHDASTVDMFPHYKFIERHGKTLEARLAF